MQLFPRPKSRIRQEPSVLSYNSLPVCLNKINAKQRFSANLAGLVTFISSAQATEKRNTGLCCFFLHHKLFLPQLILTPLFRTNPSIQLASFGRTNSRIPRGISFAFIFELCVVVYQSTSNREKENGPLLLLSPSQNFSSLAPTYSTFPF